MHQVHTAGDLTFMI